MTKEKTSLKVFSLIEILKPIEDEVSVALTSVATNPVHTAKCKELENWKSFDVYEEIQDEGQSTTNTHWVVTEKSSDGKKIVKARLVARGFEENLETRSDSPTECEESLRLFLAVTSTMAWEAKTIDIKAAFLQGNEIKREVILKPPKEAGAVGKLCELKKCVYGMKSMRNLWQSPQDLCHLSFLLVTHW